MRPELKFPLQLIKEAREYTVSLLEDLQPDDWFRMPSDGVTHIAWQVGHLAMAEFRLCLERLRDLQPDDRDMISKDFLRMHGKGSVPVAHPAESPSPEQIRATFDRVHTQVLKEIPLYQADDVSEPLANPHPMFGTKVDALYFCAKHEMLHAGQIGLVRRLLGKPPLR